MTTIKKYTIVDERGKEHLITFWGTGLFFKTWTAKLQLNGGRLGSGVKVLALADNVGKMATALADPAGGIKPAGPKFLSPKLLKIGRRIFFGPQGTKNIRIKSFSKV